MSKERPSNLAASVRQKLLNLAQERGEEFQFVLTRYAIELRSMSHGTGSFTRSYLRYEPLPSHLADKVAAESKPD